ncbi:MAG: hypothetical protein IH991_09080 [Planctomycetes bacterium]|nr:hypothetical protein [Planctomycetota bacterium]
MTPYVIKDDEDYEWLKVMEAERMHWILSDVVEMHGDIGLGGPEYFDGQATEIIYPHLSPTGEPASPTTPAPKAIPEAVPNQDQSSRRPSRPTNLSSALAPNRFDHRPPSTSQLIRNTLSPASRDRIFHDRFTTTSFDEHGRDSTMIVPAAHETPWNDSGQNQRGDHELPARLPAVD